jgi:hypothetical protein
MTIVVKLCNGNTQEKANSSKSDQWFAEMSFRFCIGFLQEFCQISLKKMPPCQETRNEIVNNLGDICCCGLGK